MQITEVLARNAREWPEDVALVEINPQELEKRHSTWREYALIEPSLVDSFRSEMTWREFDEKANRFANLLLSRNVKKGGGLFFGEWCVGGEGLHVFLQLGKEAANAKEMDKAIELLAQAEKLGNEYGLAEVAADAKDLVPQIYIMDGNNLLNEKKFAEAATEYQKALDLNGENGMAWLRLGMCKASLNDAAGAAAAFTKASEFGQKDAADKQLGNMYLKAAVAAYKAKNHAATLENVLKAAEFGNTKANIYGGMAAFNLKKYDECIKLLEGDGSVNAKYYLARAYEAKGNTAKACENYKAITSDKNFGAYATSKVGSLCK